ncbi:MAG: YggT family protein [Alphaproteobacteria bacterium]|nr:YggT family protein [Alphaproteobacteria bacterium]MCW5741081.1 YggT family protein [Alphaproteobacteria bacterium]
MAAVIDIVFNLFMWLLIIQAVMSWLLAFNVLNPRNQVVGMIWQFMLRLTEPLLRPIRRFLPNFGGIDLAPLVLILIIYFVRRSILIPLSYGQTPSLL